MLVPYRDRRDQLDVFASHMRTYLQRGAFRFAYTSRNRRTPARSTAAGRSTPRSSSRNPRWTTWCFTTWTCFRFPGWITATIRARTFDTCPAAHLLIGFSIPHDEVLLRRVRGEQSLRAVHKRIRHAVLGMGRRGRRVLRQGGEEEGWGFRRGEAVPGGLDAVFGRPDKSRAASSPSAGDTKGRDRTRTGTEIRQSWTSSCGRRPR